jgi:ABC-type uncharacterized transport system permease subunit
MQQARQGVLTESVLFAPIEAQSTQLQSLGLKLAGPIFLSIPFVPMYVYVHFAYG